MTRNLVFSKKNCVIPAKAGIQKYFYRYLNLTKNMALLYLITPNPFESCGEPANDKWWGGHCLDALI